MKITLIELSPQYSMVTYQSALTFLLNFFHLSEVATMQQTDGIVCKLTPRSFYKSAHLWVHFADFHPQCELCLIYMTFIQATQQALWLAKFFDKVGFPIATPVMIHTDNNRSISSSTNDMNHQWTKHIDVKHHFVKQKTKLGQVIFNYIPSAENITNLFTKPLPWDAMLKFVKALGLHKGHNAMIMQWSRVEHCILS